MFGAPWDCWHKADRETRKDNYQHSPEEKDFSKWPFDIPWIVAMVGKCGLEVNTKGALDAMQTATDDALERCRRAERRGWDAAMTYALMRVKKRQKNEHS